ncbi:alpha-ketoglutarate-dependent dioxygenase AlkB [Geitlerinema sp. P-1104]|uniref:alpha-ketoglutarate-dependent dioxygenase AlkB family protein n=1 Tax=Geitlerinema sp. P-1104 TaxID=2546230 RepID=UPI001476B4D0|nr:alpha-ketoglutarate-dependent dioxygenase AlkB [Geitlerinema sp. P-1104]NMG60582.1 alpha-ketoglutarate-dependent dioxygenase AlkB [Geitlerinema sp. P-1104]
MEYDSDTQLSLSLWNEAEIFSSLEIKHLSIPDGEVELYSSCFSGDENDKIFQTLFSQVSWKQEKIKCYGKELDLPRLTAWYGDTGKRYVYSRIAMEPEPWIPVLLYIKSRVEDVAQFSFNSVLLNLYRDGRDSIAWHSDDEPELGKQPVIASLSFGGERKFQLRHKVKKEQEKVELNLTHGSLLIMKGKTQEYWQHQIPKTSKPVMPRINLTFRFID